MQSHFPAEAPDVRRAKCFTQPEGSLGSATITDLRKPSLVSIVASMPTGLPSIQLQRCYKQIGNNIFKLHILWLQVTFFHNNYV